MTPPSSVLRFASSALAACIAAAIGSAQSVPRAPIVDAHFHYLGAAATAASLASMDSMGVTLAVVIGTPAQLRELPSSNSVSLIKALTLPCVGGRMPNAGVPCFADGADWPSLDTVRALVQAGTVQMLGEINTQYAGLRVDDEKLEPYLALAEALDLPVGFHLGIGPPAVSYAATPNPPYKSPAYSGAAGDLHALETVLKHHPRLRVYVMHAAWPMRDDMLYMLYMHPQLHVDLSVLQYAIPRPAYVQYVRELVEAGFERRIMFGSDGSARRVREGIDAIRAMSFLTDVQQQLILGGNAMRFFKRAP